MKSLKKIFTIFALFAMVACLSISSFALEPDAAMEEIPSEPDTVMSEADIILEKIIPKIVLDTNVVVPVEPSDIYPACDHAYKRSPVGSSYEVYDSSTGKYGYAQVYIYRCTKCGEYYYTTEYYGWHYSNRS